MKPEEHITLNALSEVHFTFDRRCQSLPEQKAIIADTLSMLEIAQGRELRIDQVAEAVSNNRVEHKVRFESKVSNPGVSAPDGVFLAHDEFAKKLERMQPSVQPTLAPSIYKSHPVDRQKIETLAIAVTSGTISLVALAAASVAQISWVSNFLSVTAYGLASFAALQAINALLLSSRSE